MIKTMDQATEIIMITTNNIEIIMITTNNIDTIDHVLETDIPGVVINIKKILKKIMHHPNYNKLLNQKMKIIKRIN